MSTFFHVLTSHHVNQRLIPFNHLFFLRRVEIKTVNDIGFDTIDVKSVGTYEVFNLPHIKQIFRNIFLMFLRCYIHNML